MDTVNTNLIEEMRRDRRNQLLENKDLISMDKVARKAGLGMKLAVTPTFFNHFYPYAEDAVKGIGFDEILWDILQLLKKQAGGRIMHDTTFGVLSKTYVKAALNYDQVETFKDGKARDKRTEIRVMLMSDEDDNPSMVLSVDGFKFL